MQCTRARLIFICKNKASLLAKGLRHLAFAVEDLDAAVAHLKKNKVAVQEIRLDELTGKRFSFFNDPSGQPLELYETSG